MRLPVSGSSAVAGMLGDADVDAEALAEADGSALAARAALDDATTLPVAVVAALVEDAVSR